MKSLEQNYNDILPLNRKERFYTGTVLPAIICYDNFKYLNRFFKLIQGFNRELSIFPDSDKNNILFQTEYSFKESIYEEQFRNKFKDNFETKDTPDLVILITEPELLLFVGEAKMFDNVKPDKISKQMQNQEWFIKALQNQLNINKKNCFHFAIVPQKIIPDKGRFEYPVVYWEEIIDSYRDIQEHDHFFNVLCIAIDKFEKLRGKNIISYGQNMENKWSGEKIVEMHNAGHQFWVGRSGGCYGEKFINDIQTGKWRTHKYEINTKGKFAPNRNWFSSKNFTENLKST